MRIWIDCNPDSTLGTTGYLVRTRNSTTGRESTSLRERPLHTNQSHEPRLSGWCGETDNKSRFAEGVGRIVAMNKLGDRAQVAKLAGEDLVVFLLRDGYPGLVPDDLQGLRAAIEAGEEDGAEDVAGVLDEQGADVVIATLRPGHLEWDEGAINAATHTHRGIQDQAAISAYYRAYARSARAAAERVRDERSASESASERVAS